MERSDIEVAKRSYENFSVELVQGSRRKQKHSNRMQVIVASPASETKMSLTLREARALRDFLNENLDSDS